VLIVIIISATIPTAVIAVAIKGIINNIMCSIVRKPREI
jgi:hypothetical protein